MKKLLVLMFAGFALFIASSCNIVREVVLDWNVISNDLEIDTSQPVEIVFWHTMGKTTNPALGGTALLEEFISEFSELYPHITVKHESKGGYNELRDAVNTALPAGTEPSMAYSYSDHVAGYINSGLVLPLNNLIYNNNPEIALSQDEIDDYVAGFWAEGMVYDNAGTMLNLPFIKSTEVMFYNKTFFDQHNLTVPTTWEETEVVLRQIKSIIESDPNLSDEQKAAKIPFGYDSEDNLFITMSEQRGIPYTAFDDSGNGQILFNNDQAKDMVAEFNALFQDRLFTTKQMMGGAYTSDKFKVGDLYLSVSSTGGTKYNVPTANFEAGVAPIPYYNEEIGQKVIQQGPNINLFYKDNVQEMIAAWLFLKYITQPEQSARFAVATGYSPVRVSSRDTDTFQNFISNPNPSAEQKLFIDTLILSSELVDYYFTSPAFDRSSKARSEVGAIFVNVFGGMSVTEAFDRAYAEVMF